MTQVYSTALKKKKNGYSLLVHISSFDTVTVSFWTTFETVLFILSSFISITSTFIQASSDNFISVNNAYWNLGC